MRGRPALGWLAAALLAAGCGGVQRAGERIAGHVLTIYFSGPHTGASSSEAMAALDGAELALQRIRSRIGDYHIRLRPLDDSTPQSGGWDPSQTTLNARLAISDPTTIGYLGDLNSGASAISIPLLNRVGIPQISPGATAVGLTGTGPGAAPGEPQKYYPSGVRTFARVVPTDAGQAAALTGAERARGCVSTFVLEDGEVDGEDAALSFLLTAQSAGLRVVGVQAFQRRAPDYAPLARGVAASGADCVLISAIDELSAAALSEKVAQTLPRCTIFATGALADAAYTDALPAGLDSRVVIVSAALPAGAYPPAGRNLLARYARRLGGPEPSPIFGYEAMSLLLSAITRATDHGRRVADRLRVRDELFGGRRIRGVLGTFRLDRTGDISLHPLGIYRLEGGDLVLWMRTPG